MSTLKITLWFLLPLLLIWFVLGLHFIPSWYIFQVSFSLIFIAILILFGVFEIKRNSKSSESVKPKTGIKIMLSAWIFVCLLTTSIKLLSGQDAAFLSNMKFFQPKKFKQEITSRNKKATIYIFETAGLMTHSENVWLRNGSLPLMKKIWSVKESRIDSVSENGGSIRIYAYETYPFLKPILITYNTESEEVDILEDTVRTRGLFAPPRK